MPVPAIVIVVALKIANELLDRAVKKIFDDFLGTMGGTDGCVQLNLQSIEQIRAVLGEEIAADRLKETEEDLTTVLDVFNEYLNTPSQTDRLQELTIPSKDVINHLDGFNLSANDSYHFAASLRLAILFERLKAFGDVGERANILTSISQSDKHSINLKMQWQDWHNRQIGIFVEKSHYIGTDQTEWLQKYSWECKIYGINYKLGECWQQRVTGGDADARRRILEKNKAKKEPAKEKAQEKRQDMIDAKQKELNDLYLDPAASVRAEWNKIAKSLRAFSIKDGRVIVVVPRPRPHR